jgi:uncharacterized protein YqhQ
VGAGRPFASILSSMGEEKLRLGGMALANGVLVHGPSAWACAVRTPDGELRLASGEKRFRAAAVDRPLLRGPARLVEAFAFLPQVRRKLPEARLPFERPAVLVAMAATTVAVRLVRDSERIGAAAKELASGLLALVPAAVALRNSSLAAYHGAEHVAIGSYEHGEPRAREHERCGSHLLVPLLGTQAVGHALAARAPEHVRAAARVTASLAALAASTELFAWMVRHPDDRLSKVLAKPGHELQHRIATANPTSEQLEVAEAALAECLRLEHGAANRD